MSFDNLCKLLSEKYPDRFAAWILGAPSAQVKVLKTELSIGCCTIENDLSEDWNPMMLEIVDE